MKHFISLLLSVLAVFIGCQSPGIDYVCPPCDQDCDTLVFSQAGVCPHCQMGLIPKSDLDEVRAGKQPRVRIEEGSGLFVMTDAHTSGHTAIPVFYHRPKRYTSTSSVLIVLPGAGRSSPAYRDSWVEASETYGVLIIAPMYTISAYDFTDYHLAGLIQNADLKNSTSRVEQTNQIRLAEDRFSYEVTPDTSRWIFYDFDRLFELVVDAVHSTQTRYDIFGHSAGAQILHRMALLYPNSKADRLVAANAGFYTLPDLQADLPFGLQNATVKTVDLHRAFRQHLVLLLGERDDASEQRGTLLRSPSADRQGLHRLERGRYFYDTSKAKAEALDTDFHWKLIVVPDVGHDHRKMGVAAANYLYGSIYNDPNPQ